MLAKVGDLLQQPSYRSKAGRVPTLTTIGEAKGVHYVVMAEVGERIKPHQLTRALAAQVRVPGACARRQGWLWSALRQPAARNTTTSLSVLFTFPSFIPRVGGCCAWKRVSAGAERSLLDWACLLAWVGGTLQALYVLEAMHNNGLRHRDIRPDNLLFFDGSVMVIDFAFACAAKPALYVWGSPLMFQKSGLIERACTEALSQEGSMLGGLGLCINGQPPRVLSRRGSAVLFAFEGRYQGARHFVSPGVSRHIADAASASTVYDFLRKDDLHSFVRVCAVNASMHLREAVYSAIRDDGVGTKGAGTVGGGGGWRRHLSPPCVVPMLFFRQSLSCAQCRIRDRRGLCAGDLERLLR